jgi:hypothetical protein
MAAIALRAVWPREAGCRRRVHEERGARVFVPDSVIQRMEKCDTGDASTEEGTAIAREIL